MQSAECALETVPAFAEATPPAPGKPRRKSLIKAIRGANEYVQSLALLFLIAILAFVAINALGDAIAAQFTKAKGKLVELDGKAAPVKED